MKTYFKHVVLLIKRLLLALVLFFIARVFFLVYNLGEFAGIGFVDLPRLFLFGLRFDISVTVYFNALIIVMHLFPFGRIKEFKGYQAFMKWYFIIVNGLMLLVNLADAIYFNFILRRSTADVLKLIFLSGDVINLLPSFIINYWIVPVFWILIMYLTFKVYPRLKQERPEAGNKFKPVNVIARYMLFILFMVIALVGGRGGVQGRPITITDASKNISHQYISIVLNTPFTIVTTYRHGAVEEVHYFPMEKAKKLYPIKHRYRASKSRFSRKNIVIILWESYSREFSGFLNNYDGFTPFMDSLMQHSRVFPNGFSNGLRSIDAIPAIISGIPLLMHEPFITSAYNTNYIESMADIFEAEGYRTAFFHGGNNGTMDFDGFASFAGFQDYYGSVEYNNNDDYDGHWGIFDEPFLQYVAKKLNDFNEPFFAFEFTLSSHNPYRIPDKYINKFADGELKIHKVIRYTDFALRRFFKTASKMPWYNNTLFVILADHPAPFTLPLDSLSPKGSRPNIALQKFYKNPVGKFAIPIVFFAPGDTSINGIDSTVIQQTDILPTLMDYLGYRESFFSFGNSVFSKSEKHYAFELLNGLYQITSGNYTLVFDGEKSIGFYDNVGAPAHKMNLISTKKNIAFRMEADIKAIIQQYRNGLFNNNFPVSKSRVDKTSNLPE